MIHVLDVVQIERKTTFRLICTLKCACHTFCELFLASSVCFATMYMGSNDFCTVSQLHDKILNRYYNHFLPDVEERAARDLPGQYVVG